MKISDRTLAKCTNLRQLPLVEVLWRDAVTFHGWGSLAEARQEKPVEARTVGRLARCDRHVISVLQTITESGKVCENWVIPRPWVLKIITMSQQRRQKRRR